MVYTMLNKLSKIIGVQSEEELEDKLYNDLICHEARLGGKLFGPVPAGLAREFFCLDENTWIWYEEWKDSAGNLKSQNIRYEVHSDSIVKVCNGKAQLLSKAEASRFFDAIRAYENSVMREVYARA